MNPLAETAARWREAAETLRRWGAGRRAEVLETCADQLDDAWDAYLREELTVERAAEESGYSAGYLRDLVRKSAIPDLRREGSQARIRIRREDLPRKPGGSKGEDAPDPDVRDLFDRIR